jgi:dTDP-4-dehydrorhamnose 3,5-epimerase
VTAGEGDYKLIVIPVGVAHGYKVVSEEPVLLFYHTTESYDPDNPDEERIPYNDPAIGFDWGSIA